MTASHVVGFVHTLFAHKLDQADSLSLLWRFDIRVP